jgi:hypothetical protein
VTHPRTSLWLVPAEPDRTELRTRIDRLALALGAPSFEPHVTLASGPADPATVAAGLARLAAERGPLELTAGPTTHGPDRYRAVVVELDDEGLCDLARAACAALGIPFDPATYRPHLSLVYAADLPEAVRAGAAAEHDLTGRRLRFDTVAAMVPGADKDDVARWQLPVVRLLSGSR